MKNIALRAAAILAAMTLASKASAQNGGEENGRRLSLAGQVVESVTREPLAGATIQVLGTRQGGISNAEGRFQIFNIPAGTYPVRISSVGYQTVVKTDVVVSNARPASSTSSAAPMRSPACRP